MKPKIGVTRKKKISCPFCSEKIYSTAKKCRYCNEWLIKSSKKSVLKRHINNDNFGWVWFFSMLIFVGFTFTTNPSDSPTNIELAIVLIAVAAGGLSFLLFLTHSLIKIFNKKINKSNRFKRIALIFLLTPLFFISITTITAIGANRNINKSEVLENLNKNDCPVGKISCYTDGKRVCRTYEDCKEIIDRNIGNSTKKTSTTNTTTIPQASNITCIGPDGKQFQTTMEECKNLNEK